MKSETEKPPAAADGSCNFVSGDLEPRLDTADTAARQVVLRPYQSATVARVMAAIEAGQQRVLLVAPTGSGKTVLAAEIIRRIGRRALFLAHRRELVTQASAKLHAAGVDHGIVAAGFPTRPGAPVQVASIQTLHARAVRSSAMDMPPAELVLVDEAHHLRAATYQAAIAEYPEAAIVGLTATPARADGRGLGSDFDALIEAPQVPELIAGGFLVPTKVYAPHVPDLDGVHTRQGDYVPRELDALVNRGELVGDVVAHYLKHAAGIRTVVFATSVAHSVNLRNEFRRCGVMAEHLDGSTPTDERDAILARLASGAVDVVTNCAVLTEGFDAPGIGCIILARPTKSLPLYRQMVGRALRPAPGKEHALILDHSGATFMHGFAEDPITWTLHPDRRAVNKSQAARSTGSRPALTTCPECKAVRLQGAPCKACGWAPKVKPQHVETRDGDLALLERGKRAVAAYAGAAERDNFHRELLGIARERGYKPGWASHKFKEKFGAWPANRYAAPIAPSPATRSWVRSRQIAYAKAMQKAGAA